MRTRKRIPFSTIQTAGAILPSDLLERIAARDADLGGLKPESYHLATSDRLNEAASRSWNVLQGHWSAFRARTEKLDGQDPGTTPTRERWLLPLFQELGYGRLQTHKAPEIGGRSYPISHSWQKTPIHLVGRNLDLDRRAPGVAGAARSSPHSLLQEFLNRSEEHLWGFVSNGLSLRILRDNLSLIRQAYVEFDLEAMMEGEAYSDFVLLWLLCHQSRVEAEKPEECWLEKWSKKAQQEGTRALDQLRDGVQTAIATFGSGFLSHPANSLIREKLQSGELSTQDYYRQLLRLVYRLLFLFVAEDRDLLFEPSASEEAKARYLGFYSTSHLRTLAAELRGSGHSDIYRAVRLILKKLGEDEGCPELGLPALGSFLFSQEALLDLIGAEIANEVLLDAIRALSCTEDQGMLRAVDYKNLGTEEFGSVYESLLELHPEISVDAGTFQFASVAGHERKTTGSYYTPSSLVHCLLDSALEPVLEEAANKDDPERAVLELKVCDPACGSGHFLIAAAHRIAKRLASVRSGEDEPPPEDVRSALRDVIGRCIYGVDVNPMAVELCKVALWMEALDPGKPLSFLDHKIQCGNSLLGATPALIANGIPDDAFKTIEGDDKKYASALRKRNKLERQGQDRLPLVAETEAIYGGFENQFEILDELDDSTVFAVREKEELYRRLSQSHQYMRSKLVADAWCSIFLWQKTKEAPEPPTESVLRQIQSGGQVPHETLQEIQRLSEDHNLFHWHLALPEVLDTDGESTDLEEEAGWRGGFDVVLGNPPWETLEFKEREWFASRSPGISAAPNAAVRRRLVAKLGQEDPDLFALYKSTVRRYDLTRAFIRNCGRYPHCARGKINTSSIFAETNRALVNETGRVGCILPSGIATDNTTRHFFRLLIDARSLVSLYDFENRNGIFVGVHRSYKFLLLTIAGRSRPVHRGAEFVFFPFRLQMSMKKSGGSLLVQKTSVC